MPYCKVHCLFPLSCVHSHSQFPTTQLDLFILLLATLPLLLHNAGSPHTKVRACCQGPLVSCVLDQFCLHIQWHQSIVMVCGYESVWGVMGGFSALIQKLCVQNINVHVCSVHMCMHVHACACMCMCVHVCVCMNCDCVIFSHAAGVSLIVPSLLTQFSQDPFFLPINSIQARRPRLL